ncbi:MAG: damage-control phosphatase ARMT1 family protein [Bacteroidota bacterium]
MKAKPQCVPCSLQQILSLKRHFPGFTDAQAGKAMMDALRRLAEQNLAELTPADITTACMLAATQASGDPDPFLAEKRRFNALALQALPALARQLAKAENPLHLALQISAAGNIIDLGLLSEVDVDAHLDKILRAGFALDDSDFLADALRSATRILLIADNAGEIVFDRPLVELLAARSAVTVAVKARPILNDATPEDALAAGLARWAEIITTGQGVLGVSPQASSEFWRVFQKADVVIAKGHANFESLDAPHPNLFFLLTAKCPVVAAALGVNEGEAVLKKASH